MFAKLRKLFRIIQTRFRYPGVIYYGTPSFLKFLGISGRALPKGYQSQYGQDELVFTEFSKFLASGDFPKTFIDIGCNHPLTHNNSHFFQVNQGYRVVAVDALREAGELWREHRADADFVECAVGAGNGEVSFEVVEGSDFASMFSAVSGASHHQVAGACVTRTVKVRRISEILGERDIRCAGIVSLDVEGYELQALQGMDFDNFFAYVFIIENNSNLGTGSNLLRDLMISKGYRYFARIWSVDDIFIHPGLLALQ